MSNILGKHVLSVKILGKVIWGIIVFFTLSVTDFCCWNFCLWGNLGHTLHPHYYRSIIILLLLIVSSIDSQQQNPSSSRILDFLWQGEQSKWYCIAKYSHGPISDSMGQHLYCRRATVRPIACHQIGCQRNIMTKIIWWVVIIIWYHIQAQMKVFIIVMLADSDDQTSQ